MTKPKTRVPGEPSAYDLALYRLRYIGFLLERKRSMSDHERLFIAEALQKIGNGEDANKCLGLVVGRGQRRSKVARDRQEKIVFVLSWVAAVIAPEEQGGLGLTLDDAFDEAQKEFGLSSETVRKYWFNNPNLHYPSFPAPISTYPRETLP